ncbi:MAG: TraR/DksA C4-type zinc finger protein [Rhodospirillaceae bacterium]|nr:TraR/DksA C4-type zinc finger protein [Rhodospirillaceae bacterium]
MADEMDQVQRLNEFHRDRALEAQQRRVRVDAAEPGRKDCRDCGETIPAARRRAQPNARRCRSCQDDFEQGK